MRGALAGLQERAAEAAAGPVAAHEHRPHPGGLVRRVQQPVVAGELARRRRRAWRAGSSRRRRRARRPLRGRSRCRPRSAPVSSRAMWITALAVCCHVVEGRELLARGLRASTPGCAPHPPRRPAAERSSSSRVMLAEWRSGSSATRASQVTTVALGSWLTYSGGIGREQTEACTRAAFDAGITLFDTANVYGTGAAETAWGEILQRLSARLVRAGDEGLLPDGAARPRALAQADPQADRRLAGAAADRLRRPLPVPPLRRHGAAAGDDGRADRGRRGGQGAPHRVLASGRRTGSRRRWTCPAWRSSSPPSRSTRRSGASPRPR